MVIEKILRGGISSVLQDRYVKSDANKKILYVDATNIYGWAISDSYLLKQQKFDKNVNFEDICDAL